MNFIIGEENLVSGISSKIYLWTNRNRYTCSCLIYNQPYIITSPFPADYFSLTRDFNLGGHI